MTHHMYLSGCHGVTTLRHRYGYHGVTPHPHVIAIYRTCMYSQARQRMTHHMYLSGCYGVTPPMSSLFIVQVLLNQTMDDSSYVYVVDMV